jgi:tripartite-type tricarboxylate transporter receptor subunit TctC
MPRLSKSLSGFVAFLALITVAGSPGTAVGQKYPAKPVRMIVPFGPGTTTDIISRLVGNSLGNELGRPLIIENRPGAGGSMGTNTAAKSPPDGHTLVMGTVGTHAINVGLYPQLPYDPLKEFVPIGVVGYTPTLLVVPKSVPARNVPELIALARSRPDGMNYASAGNGTSGHLAGELLKTRTGANLTHVPYKEGGMAMTDLISGRVEFMFYHPAAVMPHIQKNTLGAIGVSSARRSVAAPEVPTLIEQGIEDFDLVAWFALYAPAATPSAVIARLREGLDRVLGNPETASQLQAQGVEMLPLSGDQMNAFAKNEVAKWTDLVKISGARAE